MTQPANAIPWWKELPWLAAAAITPGILLLQHLDPWDSTVAIAAGSSLSHIGLTLTVGFLTGLGLALQPTAGSTETAPATDGMRRSHRLRLSLAIACCLAIGWLAIASLSVAGRGNLRFAVNGFWQWTSMIVWSTSIGLMATRPGFGRLAITAALALGVGVLVYGYWEYGIIQPELRRQLERDPIGLFRRQGVPPESSAALLLADRIRSTEMKGFFALANSLGGFLACYWIWIVTVWFSRRSRGGFAFHTALAIAVGVALLLTKSRTAWLAAGGGTALILLLSMIFNGRVRRQTLGIACGAALAVSVTGLFVVYLFDPLILKEAGKSLAYRFDYWNGAIKLIFREPWLGYGVGGFQSTYLQVKLPTAAESPADPHNFLLETAHAGGIPCLLAAGAAIALALWLALPPSTDKPTCHSDLPPPRSWRVAFWGGAAVSAACLITWSIFTDSDERLLGILLALAASGAAAVLWSRWPSAATSAHLLVHNKYPLGVAFAVLLVHFLASGGWMLPGTMSLGMLSVALSLARPTGRCVASTGSHASDPSEPGDRRGVRADGWVFAGATAAMLASWYATMALPLARSTEIVGQVLGGPLASPSPQQLRNLLSADSWDPEMARTGVDWAADRLTQPIGKGTRGEWEEVLQEFQNELLERDGKNSLAWTAVGQASARVAAATTDPAGRTEWLQRANRAFQRSVELSPSSAQGHMQAALAAFWVGDRDRSQSHCEKAEEIDAATGHRDRKIAAAQIVWPGSLVPRDARLGDDARMGLPRDHVKAEPVLRYLRSQAR